MIQQLHQFYAALTKYQPDKILEPAPPSNLVYRFSTIDLTSKIKLLKGLGKMSFGRTTLVRYPKFKVPFGLRSFLK
jgi:hypothetical protein